MKVLTAVLILVTLQCSHALHPTSCNDSESSAEKILDLINKGRRNGYTFNLLRVSDAHLDRVGDATVYYLVLDVQESDCWVLSQDSCHPFSRWPSELVIGRCKVIATRHSNKSQDLTVNGYNCTMSSVSSVLSNTKDSPVLLDFFEDSELYRKQASSALDKYKRQNADFASFRVDGMERVIRVRGGERTNYYMEFSVRNCSTQHSHKYPLIFAFCRAVFSYSVEASDLETPQDININCEVFNFEDHKNMSDMKTHEHSLCDKHHPKTDGLGCPPPLEGKDNSERPPLQEGSLTQLPPSHLPPFGTNRTHRHPHNHSCNKHPSHGHHPPGHDLHRHHPHGHHPHGHHPPGYDLHRHHPHGHHPHGHHPPGHDLHRHHPHGHHPHGHHLHGHHPHGHSPHEHDFHDYGPCDPPPNSQEHKGQYHRGYGPPHGHSRERGPGKGRFPFHQGQIGYIYRLPQLRAGEVLALPEANFPSFSLPNCNDPRQPKIQSFPETPSESCPGEFKIEFPQINRFFASVPPK